MRTKTIARWRKAALGGALSVSLAFPVSAQEAQPQQQPAAPAEAAPAQPDAAQTAPAQTPPAQAAPAQGETAPVVTEQSPRPPPATDIQPVPGAPEEYTIQKGDTLWDLSQKFLNNPWYWPKIWSQNPAIENPHWIYPGNKLRIVPGQGGAQAPAQVQAEGQQPAAPEQPAEGQQAEVATPPDQQPDSVNVSQNAAPDIDVVKRNSKEGGLSSSSVSATGKLAFTPPPVVTVRASGLVSPEEMANSGSIAASFEERELLQPFDTAYARFKGEVPAKPGDKLLIFRPDGEIVHPVTHKKLGEKTKNVGVVKVLSVKGNLATVQIEQVFEEIERGDRVGQWTPTKLRVAPKPNTQDVKGVVVSGVDNSDLSTYGESNVVFIDKGSADGVQEGNTFAVVRHGDGLNEKVLTGDTNLAGAAGASAAKVDTPDENVGLLLVVETKEHLSTAIVVKSIRELDPGDVVEMRASGSGSGGD